jgi:hypothetical protein
VDVVQLIAKRHPDMDLIYIAIAAAFFAASVGLVRLCSSLGGGK